MANLEPLIQSIPVAPLKLASLEGCRTLADQVNNYLVSFRHESPTNVGQADTLQGYCADSYLLECECPRFGSGEGKGVLKESVRGCDLFIMADVTNHSLTYRLNGYENHMSPDNHYQDLKRIISAADGKARRINVIMPFLYEGRQHKRSKRESLDCALMLQELVAMGVSNILTFDAHDPRVSNSIPLHGFDSFMPTYQFLKALVNSVPDFVIDNDHLMIISEFLGDSVEGKDVVIIDDMISSGESMLDVAKQLKEREAGRVFVCTTFGLFTDGLEKFDEYYEKGYISKVVTTNLNYRPKELLTRPYYQEADMSKFLASIIDSLNHNVSISSVQSPTDKIHKLLEKYKNER